MGGQVQLGLDIQAPLYTAGYQGRTPEQFVRLLEKHGITQVIDVREYPVSRRPGFTKKALADVLTKAGIAYVHVKEAGNPFRHAPELGRYAEHLDAHPEAVARVADEARKAPSVLLCFERNPNECHRTELARRVAEVLRVGVETI